MTTKPLTASQILIVDDHAESAEALQQLLEFDGHQMAAARSGAGALGGAEGVRPHLVSCDLQLADDRDGCAVARAMRRSQPLQGARLAALRGSRDPGALDRAVAAGFDEVVTKPIDLEWLERLLAVRVYTGI